MNEMNNGENNNQNFEQQNNVVQPEQSVQQQYVQSEQPVSEPPKKEEKKSYCGLLIVFMVISLLLAGFIVYDKVLKKEESVKQEENNNQQGNEETNKDNTDNKNDIITGKYFKIKTITGRIIDKNIQLDYKFYVTKNEFEKEEVYCDAFVNNELMGKFFVANLNDEADNDLCDENEICNFDYLYGKGSMNPKLEDVNFEIQNSIKGIGSNRGYLKASDTNEEFLYMIIEGQLYIVDKNGTVITKGKTVMGEPTNYIFIDYSNQMFEELKGCNVRFTKENFGYKKYYFTDTEIHYLWDGFYIDDEGNEVESIDEHQVSIKNGQVKNEIIKECTGTISGERL